MKLPLVGALLLALSLFASPVAAQQCFSYDENLAKLEADQYVISGMVALVEITEEQLPAFVAELTAIGLPPPGEVSRAFVLSGPSSTIVGVEIEGCFFHIRLSMPLPAKGSGRLPDGRTMA